MFNHIRSLLSVLLVSLLLYTLALKASVDMMTPAVVLHGKDQQFNSVYLYSAKLQQLSSQGT